MTDRPAMWRTTRAFCLALQRLYALGSDYPAHVNGRPYTIGRLMEIADEVGRGE